MRSKLFAKLVRSAFVAMASEPSRPRSALNAPMASEAVAMDLESVYSRAVEADLWINPGTAADLESIRAYDGRFTHLDVMSEGRVFNNNARMSPGGGNDYWESGTVRPDLILADLIKVIHPHHIPDHELFYYQKLK